jgi:flagellar protein FliS
MYQNINAHTSVVGADPHKIILLLMQNAIKKLLLAKGFMASQETHDKGLNISLAITIIETLQAILDRQKGKDIANNLYELYSYMQVTLLEANLNNNINKLEEVINLLTIIKEGWENISIPTQGEYHNDTD